MRASKAPAANFAVPLHLDAAQGEEALRPAPPQ